MANVTGKSGKASSKSLYVITVIVFGLIVLISVITYVKSAKSTELKDLPNYTEIKGDYTAEGLKYEKQPHLGDPNAKVKVIEFADFKCPACKKWEETYMDQLQQDFVSVKLAWAVI